MRQKNIHKAKIFGDITQLKGKDIPKGTEMICGGWPCQDISKANPNGRGIHGVRSGLIKQIFRLVDEMPTIRVIFLENSSAIRTRGLKYVLDNLNKRGFEVYWGIFNCTQVGAPHLRQRWMCLAVKKNYKLECFVPSLQTSWKREPSPRLVHKTSSYEPQRLQQLGNSVVPMCVARAFCCLKHAVDGQHSISGTDLIHVKTPSQKEIHVWVNEKTFKPPPLQIVMKDGAKTVVKTLWGTPTACHWHQYRQLTPRATRMLPSMLYWDQVTWESIKNRTNGSRAYASVEWSINVKFVEWLMG